MYVIILSTLCDDFPVAIHPVYATARLAAQRLASPEGATDRYRLACEAAETAGRDRPTVCDVVAVVSYRPSGTLDNWEVIGPPMGADELAEAIKGRR